MFKTVLDKFIWGVFIAVVLLAAWSTYMYNTERRTARDAQTEVTRLTGELAGEKAKKELAGKSTQIDQDALVEIPVKIEKIYVDKQVIDQSTAKKLTEINAKYAALEVSEKNKAAKEKEVSTVRINSLWSSYCVAITGETACPPALMKGTK